MAGSVIHCESWAWANGTTADVGYAARYGGSPQSSMVVDGRLPGQKAARASRAGVSYRLLLSDTFKTAVSAFSYHGDVKAETLSSEPFLGFRSDTTRMIELGAGTLGQWEVSRNGTTIASSANSKVSVDNWQFIKLGVTIHDTTGTVYLEVDGEVVINATGLDTRNGTPTTVNKIIYGWVMDNTSSDLTFGPNYITDSATVDTEEYYPDPVAVAADGATTDFVRSSGSDDYPLVDEFPAVATDYLSGSTVGEIEELVLGAIGETVAAIKAVQIVALVQKTDASSRSVAVGCHSGATVSEGADVALNSGGLYIPTIYDTDPNTAAAWDQADIDNTLAARIKVTV